MDCNITEGHDKFPSSAVTQNTRIGSVVVTRLLGARRSVVAPITGEGSTIGVVVTRPSRVGPSAGTSYYSQLRRMGLLRFSVASRNLREKHLLGWD
jgi:hypothetical protein